MSDFEAWKAAFDRDPARRKESGVRRYRVFRPVDDPKYVLIDLDFGSVAEARAFLEVMQSVWKRVEVPLGLEREPGAAASGPRARIVEEVASEAY